MVSNISSNSLLDNKFGITSIELVQPKSTIKEDLLEVPSGKEEVPSSIEDARYGEEAPSIVVQAADLDHEGTVDILVGDIEEEIDVLYKEISEWDRKYTIFTLQDDLISQLTDYYEEKRQSISIDQLQSETLSIIDMVQQYKLKCLEKDKFQIQF